MKVVITGASSGIGAALARHYAGPHSVLGLVSRRAPEPGLPGTAVPYAADVSREAEMKDVARDFVARFGAPDLVVANAGIGLGTSSDDPEDVDTLRRVLEVNVVGLAATLSAFAPAMRAAGSGTLVGIASVAAFRGLAGNGAYCASKAAALTWLESLRVELRGTGVSVVCVCPGYVDTPLTRVNRFRMPFLIDADDAARRIARKIEARARVAVIPWQMAIVAPLLHALPGWLYDPIAARAPRKPRRTPG